MPTKEEVNQLYREYLKSISDMARALPDELKAFRGLVAAVHKDGALTIKVKELIALGIAIVTKCRACMVYHVKQAVSAGAKRGEILETVGTSLLMGGGPATGHLDLVLASLEAFGAED
ncbi:MAG: carboxymuconolactone decarboxylase family protein [Candidatus Ranarchaeia archaeon]